MTPLQFRAVRITSWLAGVAFCVWVWSQAPGAARALLHALR